MHSFFCLIIRYTNDIKVIYLRKKLPLGYGALVRWQILDQLFTVVDVTVDVSKGKLVMQNTTISIKINLSLIMLEHKSLAFYLIQINKTFLQKIFLIKTNGSINMHSLSPLQIIIIRRRRRKMNIFLKIK